MDEDQIEIKNEFTNEHEELQIKDEPNDQGFILSPIENPNFGNCDNVIQREELNSKQFVKSENIQNCSDNQYSAKIKNISANYLRYDTQRNNYQCKTSKYFFKLTFKQFYYSFTFHQ